VREENIISSRKNIGRGKIRRKMGSTIYESISPQLVSNQESADEKQKGVITTERKKTEKERGRVG